MSIVLSLGVSCRRAFIFGDASSCAARCRENTGPARPRAASFRPYDARIGRTRHAPGLLRCGTAEWLSRDTTTRRRPMTKIAYEDFERQVVQHHLIKGNVYENGAALVERANRWIAEHRIDVLNVESLSTFGAGDDTSVSHWYSGIRVWYRTE